MKFKEILTEPKQTYRFFAKVFAYASLGFVFLFGTFAMTTYMISGTDFVQLYLGTSMIFSSLGHGLYSAANQIFFNSEVLKQTFDLPIIYRAIPSLALPFFIFPLLTLESAYKLFVVINIAGVLVLRKELSKILNFKDMAFLEATMFLFPPLIVSILIGQVSILLMLVVAAVFKNLRKNGFVAGLFCSLFINKVQYLVLLPFVYILSSKKSELLKGFMLGGVVIIMISTLLVGAKGMLSYPGFLMSTETNGFGSLPGRYPTLASFLYLLKVPGKFIFIINAVVFLATLLLFASKKRSFKFNEACCLSVVLTPVFTVHFGHYDLLILLFPIAYLLKRFINTYKNKYLFAFGILYLVPLLTIRYTKFSFLTAFLLLFVAYWFWYESNSSKKKQNI